MSLRCMDDGCTVDVGPALEMVQTVRSCSLTLRVRVPVAGDGAGAGGWLAFVQTAGTDAEGWKMAGGGIDSGSEEW